MRSFYLKLAVIFSIILVVFGVLVAYISIRASSQVAQEALQKTNKDLAANLVREIEPMVQDEFDQEKIEARLVELKGSSPQFDFYLLNSNGAVKSVRPGSGEDVVRHQPVVDTAPLDAFIDGEPMPILASDPLNPGQRKPFSVAHISIMGSQSCYLYVVLEGEEFTETFAMLTDSYITRGSILIIGAVLLLSLAVGLLLFRQLTQRLNKIKSTVTDFERGELTKRIAVKGNDELSELSRGFNRMADNLYQSMLDIQKSDRLRRELVANVSHDLRSPLASIQGYLETIQIKGKDLTKEQFNQYIETAIGNTKRLNNLIGDLFDLSKLDAENVQPVLESVSVAELVQDLVLQFKPIAEKKNMTLTAGFPETSQSYITADIGLLNRAISNLINNAIEHTPEGGTVTVGFSNEGTDVRIEVSDTGSGIPEADLPHIFDRFYQADKSRTSGSNAGLGLAIAKKIFNLHNGKVSVESPGNSGTTFKIWIPSS
ncbi:MAG: HAMP domain-containing protein [Bacteroidetes bacterium]|jgi:signal transduction histidine kinase|nr:HAMP domain-containing protein [Bacteroidota bacterium]